eukprot:comp74237_c0_seq1/m.48216 comp74237_c0_seq1/g.48216  ORF comp74237_c0_seq1/g.48216 comp74237_c0_seq1/m.48216 type:complete len:128 (-) comp74237_c0_seq1:2581-2964(-)
MDERESFDPAELLPNLSPKLKRLKIDLGKSTITRLPAGNFSHLYLHTKAITQEVADEIAQTSSLETPSVDVEEWNGVVWPSLSNPTHLKWLRLWARPSVDGVFDLRNQIFQWAQQAQVALLVYGPHI